MLKAIHLMTSGLSSEEGLTLIEEVLGRITGIARIAAVASIGLVSIMYDDTKANVSQIVRALQRAGFQLRPAVTTANSGALPAV